MRLSSSPRGCQPLPVSFRGMVAIMTAEEVIERHRRTLNAFVLRARRVEAHSLASDPEVLQKLASAEMKLEYVVQENQAYLRQSLPPEEQVESAAARVRPLILENDEVHYIKVMNALGYFARDSPDERLREAIAAIRTGWTRVQPRGTTVLGSSVQIEDPDGNRSDFLSDTELAFAWIYGDVVHNDADRLEATKMHGVKERFRAAAPIVGYIMVLTKATLNVTRRLVQDGLVDLDQDVLTADVTVKETEFRYPTEAWIAPVGTPLPVRFSTPSPEQPAAP